MLAPLRIPLFAALAALVLTGSSSASYAANCEAQLRANYKCSARFDDGGSAEYCLRPDVGIPGDGQFWLYEAETTGFNCTCEAKGRAPDLEFGASSRDFFCGSYDRTVLALRSSGARITGQGFNTDYFVRSVFTCQAVPTCP